MMSLLIIGSSCIIAGVIFSYTNIFQISNNSNVLENIPHQNSFSSKQKLDFPTKKRPFIRRNGNRIAK